MYQIIIRNRFQIPEVALIHDLDEKVLEDLYDEAGKKPGEDCIINVDGDLPAYRWGQAR